MTGPEVEDCLPIDEFADPRVMPDYVWDVLTEEQCKLGASLRWRLLLRQCSLLSRAKLVGLVLNTYVTMNSPRPWPSLDTLEAATGLCRHTVLKGIADLEAAGFLAVDRRHRHVSHYIPCWPPSETYTPASGRPLFSCAPSETFYPRNPF